MIINVTRDNVVIDKNSIKPHENEYNITQCHFTFDDFIDSFQVKRVIFTVESTGEMYENDILDYECEIPSEVLEHEYETVRVGVYGYNIGENEELINRFSPSYDTFVVPTGSYKEGALSPEPITPSQYDIYSSKLQEGLDKVDEALEEVSNVNISAEQLDDGISVTITNRDGEPNTVVVHDGEKGDTGERGPQGVPGYTPQKGIDYFTASEINDIKNDVETSVKTDLDFDNTISEINQDITDLQNNKVDKVQGKGLSTNDYTTEEKNKLASLENYDDTEVKTDINNLKTNKADKSEIPEKTSELTNDSGYITNAVDNLLNYYKKNETFTKQEVNDLISAITTMDLRVVEELPTQDISTTTIYLVPKNPSETNNAYDEYIYVSNNWEFIGSTEVDLTDYVKNTDYASSSKGGVIKANESQFGTKVSSTTGTLYGEAITYNTYQTRSNGYFISKGTLENVITGKDLTTKAYVDGLVGDISSVIDAINGEVV